MDVKTYLDAVIVIVMVQVSLAAQSHRQYIYKPEAEFLGNPETFSVSSNHACALSCLFSPAKCESFKYHRVTGECALSPYQTMTTNSASTEEKFYENVNEPEQCRDGWKRNSVTRMCMMLVTTSMNIQNAQENCERLGGSLLVLSDPLAYQWFNYLRDNDEDWREYSGNSFFVGASKQNGTWLWDDSIPVDSSSFSPNEPSGNGDCIQLFSASQRYRLDDFSCFGQRYSICESLH